MSELSKRLRKWVIMLRQDGYATIPDDIIAAAEDVERLDKLDRTTGPVELIGRSLQGTECYRTWEWRDAYMRFSPRRRSVRECIDDIKETV